MARIVYIRNKKGNRYAGSQSFLDANDIPTAQPENLPQSTLPEQTTKQTTPLEDTFNKYTKLQTEPVTKVDRSEVENAKVLWNIMKNNDDSENSFAPETMQTLTGYLKSMNTADREAFVQEVFARDAVGKYSSEPIPNRDLRKLLGFLANESLQNHNGDKVFTNETLSFFANHDDDGLRYQLSEHPNASTALRYSLIRSEDDNNVDNDSARIIHKIIKAEDATPQMLQKIIKMAHASTNPYVRSAILPILHHKNTPTETLTEYYNYNVDDFNSSLAVNPNTPKWILEKIAADTSQRWTSEYAKKTLARL